MDDCSFMNMCVGYFRTNTKLHWNIVVDYVSFITLRLNPRFSLLAKVKENGVIHIVKRQKVVINGTVFTSLLHSLTVYSSYTE